MSIDPSSCRGELLPGEKVYLRPVEPGDYPRLHQWANDPDTRVLIGEALPSTLAATQEYYEQIQKAADRVWLAVVAQETNQLIGDRGAALLRAPGVQARRHPGGGLLL